MKLTLQILDAGETFLVPLERSSLILGSSPSVDLRLREEGVAEQHARLEPIGEDGFRLVDLALDAVTRVNGDDVVQARLAVGDRIEIGRAVLVVGERRERPRTPRDVVAEGRSGGVSRRRVQQDEGGSRRLLVGGVVVLAAVVVGLLQMLSSDSVGRPQRWGDLLRASRDGRTAEARALLDGFRSDWAGSDAERIAMVDRAAAQVDAVEQAIVAAEQRALQEAVTLSYTEQLDSLNGRIVGNPDDPESIAARVTLSRIEDLRREGKRLAAAAARAGGADAATPDPVAAGGEDGPDRPQLAGPGAAGEVVDGVDPRAEADAEFVAEQIAQIEAAREAGRYNEALETLRLAAGTAGAADSARLDRVRVALESAMRSELDRLIDAAQTRAGAGEDADVVAAIALLEAERARFPAEGPFGRLHREIAELGNYRQWLSERPASSASAGVASGSGSTGSSGARLSYSEVSSTLEEARRADAAGEWADAMARYAVLADQLRDRDPGFAAEIDGRRADLSHLVALLEWDLQGGDTPRVGVLGEVEPAELAAALRKGRAPAAALVGGAVLAYRQGARGTAEDLLARSLKADDGLREAIDGVIARGRGESLDELGYRLVDGAFVAERDLRVLERARELERELDKLLRQQPDKRAGKIEEILASGPAELDALILAMRRRAEHYAERLNADAFHDHYDQIAALRTDLDDARRHAKNLIFDEVKYFYPYRAPAVSGAKESEYWKVQSEIDARVGKIRDIWEGEVPGKRVSKTLLRSLEQVDWLLEQLRSFGETMPTVEHDVLWARTVPTDEPLTLGNFCWDVTEQRALRHARAVLVVNEGRNAEMTRGEQRQVEITNDYRMMFGHRPLVVDPRLIEATRGHAEEMSRLGYFSHFSPTPGRKLPFERMKLAGYTSGASENIALHSSAESAHHGWTHSSGHHRNLLAPGHTEFAVGNDGRYWVQNFGRGDDYRNAEEYQAALR